ncbi:unnamed protein product [Ectocarpus sp. 6 AP-2014]
MAGRVAMAILLIASGAAAAGGAERRAEVVNTQVQRKIDVSTQFAKVVTTYTVQGTSGSYKFALPADAQDHLAFMSVTMDKAELEFELDAPSSGRDSAGEGLVLYSAAVERPQDKEEVKIAVKAVYTDVLTAFPKEITQLEEQSVVFASTLLAPSPYKTVKQTTTLKLASPKILSMTEAPSKRSVKSDQVTYGPFEDVPPFADGGELRIHYVNHAAFAKATSCLREIEVSNWGNIAVEEHYDLVHAGAKMKGGFSRMDYMAKKHAELPNPSFRKLDAYLPAGASDIYYRDNIGNISTSTVRHNLGGVELSVLSRFPMYGGWKNAWYQGYNLPTEAGLRHSGSHFTLEMPFGPPFPSVWVEDLTVKVILPEGAHNIVALPPFEGVSEARTERFTFLDTTGSGRPVVIMKMKNVVKEHNVMLKVTYDFNRARMMVEPLLLAGFFLACFLAAMAAGRVDMRIRRGGADAAPTKG